MDNVIDSGTKPGTQREEQCMPKKRRRRPVSEEESVRAPSIFVSPVAAVDDERKCKRGAAAAGRESKQSQHDDRQKFAIWTLERKRRLRVKQIKDFKAYQAQIKREQSDPDYLEPKRRVASSTVVRGTHDRSTRAASEEEKGPEDSEPMPLKRRQRAEVKEHDSGQGFSTFQVNNKVTVCHSSGKSSALFWKARVTAVDVATQTFSVHIAELVKDLTSVPPKHLSLGYLPFAT